MQPSNALIEEVAARLGRVWRATRDERIAQRVAEWFGVSVEEVVEKLENMEE